ncbi:hypothetical protein [Afipia clevelandensis]|uniref:DUF5681 domain-containing protein n=1 Tax=Afipia clevelandensis ATCC 49720 TaxID=883079 RepID=K8PHG8_9BRAD|nr:hypothetical protein [Afipia clevelandensis]EKS37768.1 hypothetical protein HMPREF9696_01718 [Afipia clevelandensis ATCC 49720]
MAKAGRPKGAINKDKPFSEALRMELNAAGEDHKALRKIAAKVISMAENGDMQAINAIADRLDGKPAQESTVTFDDKREAADWSRAELVAFLNERRNGGSGATEADGRGPEPDSVH